MATTLRGRTVGYDNILVGSAEGTERTISGSAPPAEKVGGRDNITIAKTFPTSNIADNQSVGVATIARERNAV